MVNIVAVLVLILVIWVLIPAVAKPHAMKSDFCTQLVSPCSQFPKKKILKRGINLGGSEIKPKRVSWEQCRD